MTTALITGVSGFVGPYLAEHLQASGDEVVGTSTANGGPDLLDSDAWHDLVAKHRPDVIYHLAGLSDVGTSWNHPKEAFAVNAMGTLSVLEAVRTAGSRSRILVVSSADVYGKTDAGELPIPESTPARPNSPYGASKLAAEELARQYHRGWGVKTIVARPFNHTGPGQSTRFVAPGFAGRIVDCEILGGGIVTHGDLSARRDFTDVRDVVKAYRLLATHGTPGETYNVCSGQDVAMSEILDSLVSMATVPIITSSDPELMRPVDLAVLRGSSDRLAKATGWAPTIEIAETLRDILAHARSHSTSGVTQ